MKKFEIIVNKADFEVLPKVYDVFDLHCSKWCRNLHHQYKDVSKVDHVHIGGWLPSDRTPLDIAKWFSAIPFLSKFGTNSIQSIKGQWSTYCLYIGLHYKQPDKEPIDIDTTQFWASDGTNLSVLVDKVSGATPTTGSASHTKDDMPTWIDDILEGKIREYNIGQYVNKHEALLYDVQIRRAFKIFAERYKEENIMKDIYWIYGDAGVGKTLLAKHLAKHFSDTDGSYYISSDRNPLDDYKGQQTIILDDVSTDSISCKGLLKLLDPYNTAPASARYYNKLITAKNIIVTSTVSPQSWWTTARQVSDSNNGDWTQLLRRLNGGAWHIVVDNGIHSVTGLVWDSLGGDAKKITCDVPENVWLAPVNPYQRVTTTLSGCGIVVKFDDGLQSHSARIETSFGPVTEDCPFA